ncbi:hypothetical protein [Bdellovibrio bacteriovorus]|uniref:hypothetical protein n=1 Tax=Bdellovibrio TaxID=958 RepID=UPI0035A8EF66
MPGIMVPASQLQVVGENDSDRDTLLKASVHANFEWSGDSNQKYRVRIMQANGAVEHCAPVIVTGVSTDLSGCNFSDQHYYKAEIVPVDETLNPMWAFSRLFEFLVLKLRLNHRSLDLLTGESLFFAVSDGLPNYTFTDSGTGYLNTTNLNYQVPLSALPGQDTVTVVDANGTQDQAKVSVRGFSQTNFQVNSLPIGASYAIGKDVTRTANGVLLAITMAESAVWMDTWITFRSTDNGRTWSKSELFMWRYDEETYGHAIAASPDGSAYACGTEGRDTGYDWTVRKTTDDGLTWSTVHKLVGAYACYGIAVNSSGRVYTIGEGLTNNWEVYESADGGVTFNQIDSVSGTGYIVEVDPNGNLWAVGKVGANLTIRKGVYGAGTWTWTDVSVPALTMTTNFWHSFGQLIFKSSTEFYLVGTFANQMRVLKSTDSGMTWTEEYTTGVNGYGLGIALSSDNDTLVVSGYAGTKAEIHRRDSGVWSKVPDANLPCGGCHKQGGPLLTLPNGDILGFFYESPDDDLGRTAYSTDKGLSWSSSQKLLWGQPYDVVPLFLTKKRNGDLWFATESANDSWIWGNSLHLGTNNGSSWQKIAESFLENWTDQLKFSHGTRDSTNNYFYATSAPAEKLYASTDGGSTWQERSVANLNSAAVKISYLDTSYDDSLVMVVSSATEVQLRVSTNKGVSWIDKKLFPITVGAANFVFHDLYFHDAQNIFLVGEETRSGVSYYVVYKTDQNFSTWSLMKEAAVTSINKVALKRGADGAIYSSLNSIVYKSSDAGATWQATPGTWPSFFDFAVDSKGRVFVMSSTYEVMALSTYSNSLFVVQKPNDTDHWDFDAQPYMLLINNKVNFPVVYPDEQKGSQLFMRELPEAN